MNSRWMWSVLVVLVVPLAVAAESREAKAMKPRLAILDFPPASGGWSCAGWNQSEHRMSDVLRDLFTTEIGESSHGKVRVIERERLKDIRSELSFEQSGEVDGATAQKIGKLLGVRYMLSGKITRFACKKSEAATGWGVGALVGKVTGSPIAGAVAGSVHTAKMKFTGRIDARLIDTQTGEILGTFKDEEETADTSVKVAGGGTQVDYDEELVNKVYEPIVQRLAPKMVKKIAAVHQEVLAEEDEDDAPAPKRKKGSDDDEPAEAGKGKRASSGDDAASATGAGTRKGAAASGATALELYGNDFDFVPGDRVLFYDDFSDTDVGDSPMRWRGAGLAVVESEGRRWALSSTGATQTLRLDVKNDLPKKFTIEFDALFGDAAYAVYVPPERIGAGWAGVQAGGSHSPTPPTPGVHHVSIGVNDTYVKVYVDGKRAHQDTDGLRRPVRSVQFRAWANTKAAKPMFTNFRLAEGGKDYATELTSLGRIVTHGIMFDTGSDRIRPESGPTLQKILRLLQGDSALAFEIQGHTDSQGSDAVNAPLSERRAAAVKAWLVAQGIDEVRLSAKGFGATKPLEPNDTAEGRANNRRVEFVRKGA